MSLLYVPLFVYLLQKKTVASVTGINATTVFKQQYNSVLTTATNKMGHYNTRSFRHFDASVSQTGV